MPATDAVERRSRPERSLDPLKLLATVGSPIALASALLLYFGWVRSDAQAKAFGAHVSVFGMSPQELVLRSVNTLFFPIVVILLAWLLLVRLRPVLSRSSRRLAGVLRWSWVLAPVGLLVAALGGEAGRSVLPLWWLVAVGGTWYSGVLRRRSDPDSPPAPLAVSVLVGALVIVLVFWQTERLARLFGQTTAEELKRNLGGPQVPSVAVYSPDPISIEAPGVQESVLRPATEGQPAQYRYDGLYFLQQSGGKLFLVTGGWNEQRGKLLVLHDTESIRLEFGD